MAYEQISDLNADVTVSLGGMNKKTGKVNPTKIEGYYLGKKEVEDKKKKSGVSYIYILQTAKGNVGVWGKTDLDRKMSQASVGLMTLMDQNGMQDTPNGPMYKYKVAQDKQNSISVASQDAEQYEAPVADSTFSNEEDEVIGTYDEDELSEPTPPRPVAPRAPQSAVANQSRAAALLAKNRK